VPRTSRCAAGTRCWRGATSSASRRGRPQPAGDHEVAGPPLPSYEALFSQSRNHLSSPAADRGRRSDRAAVLDALRCGRFYIGLDALAGPTGSASRWRARRGAGRWATTWRPGGPARRRAAFRGLRVVLPAERTSGGGGDGRALEVALPGPGVYRVEVREPGWPVRG